MNRIVFIAVILFAANALAFSQNGSLRGTITSQTNGQPLHGVLVELKPSNQTATTDDDGVYQFKSVQPGRYTIITHLEGFAEAKQNVTVGGDASAITADFQLQLAGVRENVTVTASGAEQSTFEAIGAVSSVDSSQITSRAAVGLGELGSSRQAINRGGIRQ